MLVCMWLLITLVVSAQETDNPPDRVIYPVSGSTEIRKSVPEVDNAADEGDLIAGFSLYVDYVDGEPFQYYYDNEYWVCPTSTYDFQLAFDAESMNLNADNLRLVLTVKDEISLGTRISVDSDGLWFTDSNTQSSWASGDEIILTESDVSLSPASVYTLTGYMPYPTACTVNTILSDNDLTAPTSNFYVRFYGVDSEFPPRLEVWEAEPANPDLTLYPDSAYTTEIFNFEGVGLTNSFEGAGNDLVASKVHTDNYDEYGSFCTDTSVGHTFQLNFDPNGVSFPVGSAQLVLTLADIQYDSIPLFSELYHEPSWASGDFPTTPNSEIIFELDSSDDIYAPHGTLLIELACNPVQLRSANKQPSAAIQWVRFHGMDSEFPPRLEIWEAESVPLAIELSSTAVSTLPNTQIIILYTIICILTIPILSQLKKSTS